MPFWRKSKKAGESVSRLATQSTLAKSAEDLAVFRPSCWVAMKVWLPEPVDIALRQLAEHGFQSRSDFIREALFVYVYGRYTFEQMKLQDDGLFYLAPRESQVLFSRSQNRTPSLGKNSINYKVWLPNKLRDDLSTLASEAGITLSHFVREALISALLGHSTLPARTIALRTAQETPEDWPSEESDGKE